MASPSRSMGVPDVVSVEEAAGSAEAAAEFTAAAVSGWLGVAAVPEVPIGTAGFSASVLFCSTTGCFGSFDCRWQETNNSGSATAAAQAALRIRSGCINDLRPGAALEQPLIDSSRASPKE